MIWPWILAALWLFGIPGAWSVTRRSDPVIWRIGFAALWPPALMLFVLVLTLIQIVESFEEK